MLHVLIEKKGQKDLKRLEKRYLVKVRGVFDQLQKNPLLGEKMSGNFKGCYRVKIPPLRIIYSLDIRRKEIRILAIGYRGGIYK